MIKILKVQINCARNYSKLKLNPGNNFKQKLEEINVSNVFLLFKTDAQDNGKIKLHLAFRNVIIFKSYMFYLELILFLT